MADEEFPSANEASLQIARPAAAAPESRGEAKAQADATTDSERASERF